MEDEIIKVTPDKEKAKNLYKMVKIILKRIKSTDKASFTSLIISDYYEVIKELITAVLICKGIKTLSHKLLIEQIRSKLTEDEYYLLDELRVIRNKINYDGFFVGMDYLNRKESRIKSIISKLSRKLETIML